MGESDPRILEYKYSLDGLISDMAKEQKFAQDVNFCVCWDAGTLWKGNYSLEPLLVGDEGSNREIFGSTHALMISHQRLMEVLVLKDLVAWFKDPAAAEAHQKLRYTA
jgi:hypothetical protein